MVRSKNSEIARTNIKPTTVAQLWGRAASRCELCNKPLYIDSMFGIEGVYAENAHIHGVGVLGPRHKEDMTQEEINDISNLMLLCREHHKMIDTDPDIFGEDFLITKKTGHEERIRRVTDIMESQETRIVSYFSPIDSGYFPEHNEILLKQAVLKAEMYPRQSGAIALNRSMLPYQPTQKYYQAKVDELTASFLEYLRVIQKGESISLFAFSPQPLLIKLGTLLNDQYNVKVFQCHRTGHKWAWKGEDSAAQFTIAYPMDNGSTCIALLIDLSAPVDKNRINQILGENIPICRLSTDYPNRDFVTVPDVQDRFIRAFRETMEKIKHLYPKAETIHLFPVMPTSLNIRLGMDIMLKADLPFVIYDQNRLSGGFFETIKLGG